MRKSERTPLEVQLAQLMKRMKPRAKLRNATTELHRAMIRLVLARNTINGRCNLSAAARELGISRDELASFLREM